MINWKLTLFYKEDNIKKEYYLTNIEDAQLALTEARYLNAEGFIDKVQVDG